MNAKELIEILERAANNMNLDLEEIEVVICDNEYFYYCICDYKQDPDIKSVVLCKE